MDAKDAIRSSMNRARAITKMLLADLTDADLAIRPSPGANTIAWQLGHLIISENGLVNGVKPGSMPDLPAGFADKYKKETADKDDVEHCSKDEFLRIFDEQRTGTMAVLDAIDPAEFDKPGPERIRKMAPTVGEVFVLVGNHEFMHLGQFSSVRRSLNKPRVF